MTEAEWLACTNPLTLLSELEGKRSDRKFRLFCVGYLRIAWQMFPSEIDEEALANCELFADGKASSDALWAMSQKLDRPLGLLQNEACQRQEFQQALLHRTCRLLLVDRVESAFGGRGWEALLNSVPSDDYPRIIDGTADWTNVQKCDLIRDVFGPIQLHDTQTVGNAGLVSRLLETIYEDRTFDRLPILADALEEAGCTDAAILEHCRGPGPHVRGCWVVDLLLGKE